VSDRSARLAAFLLWLVMFVVSLLHWMGRLTSDWWIFVSLPTMWWTGRMADRYFFPEEVGE